MFADGVEEPGLFRSAEVELDSEFTESIMGEKDILEARHSDKKLLLLMHGLLTETPRFGMELASFVIRDDVYRWEKLDSIIHYDCGGRCLWDNPVMKLVSDKDGRSCSAKLFPPHTAFDASRQPDGSVQILQLVEKEVPTVKPVRTREGFLMLPVKVKRESIRSAIRTDRREPECPQG